MHITRHIPITFSILILWGLFDAGSCLALNAPISTIGAVSTYGNTATIPVTAINITNIGSFGFQISYDPSVVQPVSVTKGTMLGGNLSVNLNNPGVILLSWYTYPGVTLAGNPVILNINFNKTGNGTSPLAWQDDGSSCAWFSGSGIQLDDIPTSNYYFAGSLSFYSPDAPHTILPEVYACQGTIVSVPVKVTGFNNIGKVALKLNYNPAVLGYQSSVNSSGFPGLLTDGSQPGTVMVSGIIPSGGTGFFLADSAVLVTLEFTFSGGASDLVWVDNGISCQYAGAPPVYFDLTDVPQNSYYINGSVTGTSLPSAAGVITGPQGGNVCPGQSGVNFSISPVPNASAYVWLLPPDAVITSGAFTNDITVAFGNTPGNGDVTVYGNNGCGNGPASPVFSVFINAVPAITQQPVSPGTVNAGAGSASFTIGAEGSLLTFQWQVLTSSWTDLSDAGVYSGAMSSVLTITDPPASMDSSRYRCVVNGFCPPQAISDGEAMLTVNNLTGTDPDKTGNIESLDLSIWSNPVQAATSLHYFLPSDGNIEFVIRNICGKIVDVLHCGQESKGFHTRHINLSLNPGLYFVTLTLRTRIGEHAVTEKIMH